MAEYIYIVDGIELQSKTVILEGSRPQGVDALPPLELRTERGEVYLQPRSIYPDPLRGGDHVLVLCDAHVPPQVRARTPARARFTRGAEPRGAFGFRLSEAAQPVGRLRWCIIEGTRGSGGRRSRRSRGCSGSGSTCSNGSSGSWRS